MNRPITLRGLLSRARSRTVLTYAAAGFLLVVVIVLAGKDIVRHIDATEAWIANLGPWGVLAFIGLFVVATSLLLPESVLSIMAGALFGLTWGLAAVAAGNLLAASLQYALSQRLLQVRIARALAARPPLAAIQRAVSGTDFKLQLLLRLTPLNPATISYMLGAAGVRFSGFLFACLGLAPHVLIEVYFGYAGTHVARMVGRGAEAAYLHDLIVIGGFAVTLIVIVLVSRMAHKAVMEAVSETATQAADATE